MSRRKLNHRRSEELISAKELDSLLSILLALDRTVVELSMLAYNIPPRYRLAMRKQNRLFHDAVKKHLPFLSDCDLMSKNQGFLRSRLLAFSQL